MKTITWALRHPLYALSQFVTGRPYSHWIVTAEHRAYVEKLERARLHDR